MLKLREVLQKKRESGATMVEYAIMVAVFAIALIIAVGLMRQAVGDGFRDVCLAIDSAVDSSVDCGTEDAAPT